MNLLERLRSLAGLATRFGCAAAELVLKRTFGYMVAVNHGVMGRVPLAKVAGKTRRVARDHELVKAARSVGTSFGQ